MALTPEDVVNKRFQPTKFREGYDQDEVDDFLDEVVVELRRLGQENEELRQRLIAGEARINELQRSGAQSQQYAGFEPPRVPAPAEHAAVEAPAAVAAPVSTPVSSVDSNSANDLLQLARRIHEEHVREGIEKRDALIAEGRATAERLVGEAEAKQREEVNALEKQRTGLEQRIDDLRNFEREYRQKLKGHIEGLLHDLESSSVTAGASTTGSGNVAPVNAAASNGASPHYQDFGGN